MPHARCNNAACGLTSCSLHASRGFSHLFPKPPPCSRASWSRRHGITYCENRKKRTDFRSFGRTPSKSISQQSARTVLQVFQGDGNRMKMMTPFFKSSRPRGASTNCGMSSSGATAPSSDIHLMQRSVASKSLTSGERLRRAREGGLRRRAGNETTWSDIVQRDRPRLEEGLRLPTKGHCRAAHRASPVVALG